MFTSHEIMYLYHIVRHAANLGDITPKDCDSISKKLEIMLETSPKTSDLILTVREAYETYGLLSAVKRYKECFNKPLKQCKQEVEYLIAQNNWKKQNEN